MGDELSDPEGTFQALRKFIRYDPNREIIKRVIITSRPGCVLKYRQIRKYFNLEQMSEYKDNLVVDIAPFTKENCKDLVTNLLTLWNEEVDQHRIQKVQNYASKFFAESPILINMICNLSFEDQNLDIETATILDIYHKICDKLVDRYLKKRDLDATQYP